MLSALDVSTSALVAQRTRLNTISGNLPTCRRWSMKMAKTNPINRALWSFKPTKKNQAQGMAAVKVSSIETDDSEPLYRWQPDHPLAATEGKWKGYVAYPKINMNEQFVDALEASRAYEANIGVIEVSKNITRQNLSILA